MVVAPFRVRTQPRWTDQQPTFVGRWPSQLLRVAFASVLSFSSRTPSVWQNLCLFL